MSNIAQEVIKTIGTILCGIVLMLPIAIAIFFGIRGWKPFTERILQNQQEGKYTDWNKPPVSSKIRLLSFVCLLSILIMFGWLIVVILNPRTVFSSIGIALFIVCLIPVIMSSILLIRMVLKK